MTAPIRLLMDDVAALDVVERLRRSAYKREPGPPVRVTFDGEPRVELREGGGVLFWSFHDADVPGFPMSTTVLRGPHVFESLEELARAVALHDRALAALRDGEVCG